MKVKVAAVQYSLKDINHTSAFAEQVEKYVMLAAEHQPQFLLFPELSRRAMQLGARIIFCPSCTDTRQGMYRVRSKRFDRLELCRFYTISDMICTK